MSKVVRGRFAPSPSGRMHLGNVFTALLAWLSVRSAGGILVLRIEDLDPQRCKETYAQQLARDLEWLGLDWDEGYEKGGPHAPYLQSRRTQSYEAAFCTLGEQVYPCFCSRAERFAASAPHASDGQTRYSGRCRTLTAEERANRWASRTPAWRLAMPDQEVAFVDGCQGLQRVHLQECCEDVVLRRSDGVYAYQLAVVADDGAMEINQVVRGRDLLIATPCQLYLYERLGLSAPDFYHVPLLLASDGRRLSKREGDLDMGALRSRLTPQELLGRLAFLAGLLAAPEPISAQELIPIFSWEMVSSTDVVVPKTLLE